MGKRGRDIRWVPLILSFIGAVFVGPALGAGAALLTVVILSILTADFALADTLGTAVAIAGSVALFLGSWWVFYRLAKRNFE